jgi:hypothetical protein
MIESKDIVLQIRKLLEDKLDLKIKDHGLWRIQCLIHDEIKEKKELTNNKV